MYETFTRSTPARPLPVPTIVPRIQRVIEWFPLLHMAELHYCRTLHKCTTNSLARQIVHQARHAMDPRSPIERAYPQAVITLQK